MNTNILRAISAIVSNPVVDVANHYKQGKNRMNSMGDALELYVRDLFCSSLEEHNIAKKEELHSQFFSYMGNQNNPPDLMLKEGDAIEVKKIEGNQSSIALNSSYPKDKLYSDSPMITEASRHCEDWDVKDLIYIVGAVNDGKLKSLWIVYGTCYAADRAIYERVKNKISEGINELTDVAFAETNELARVNRVDPLGLTYLRIRGMWGIEHPRKVFSYLVPPNEEARLTVNAIMLKEKFESFPAKDRQLLESQTGTNFTIKQVKIKSPNNPAKKLEAIHLRFVKL
jgi:hypothetical protein